MQHFKHVIFMFMLFSASFFSYGSCSNFSNEATNDLNEGEWQYQRHQRKKMKWRQRQKEKKQEEREHILKVQENRKNVQRNQHEVQSQNQRSKIESAELTSLEMGRDDFSSGDNAVIFIPPLDVTTIIASKDSRFSENNSHKMNDDKSFQSGALGRTQKKKVKKHITFDNPSEQLIPLEGKILDVLKRNASKRNNYEDMCTLILRPWHNHQDKKTFLRDQWNDYMAHVTYQTDNVLQSFAQFLLCRRYGDKKVLLPAIRHNLRHVLSHSSTYENSDFIRYHMSIDSIDVYLFSKKKEFLNIVHLYNARKFLKEMGETYPIAAHYYVMFSLNKKLIHLWENDRYDPYDQKFLFNYYQRLLNLGFPETYTRSLNLQQLCLTERQNQRLLTLFKEKQMMTNQEREKAYRRYLKTQK